MRKNSAEQIVRGGQTTQHWVRMGTQVIKGTISFAALVFVIAYLGLCLSYFTLEGTHVTYGYKLADFMVENRGNPDTLIRFKKPGVGFVKETAESIYLNDAYRQLAEQYTANSYRFAAISLIPAGVAALLAFLWFIRSGKRLETDRHVRGTQLVSATDLKRWSERKWKAYRKMFGKDFKHGPQYTIAGIKFPPNAVEAQTSICGTVGTGKSNAIKELLTTIREHHGRVIIYDRMGAYVRDFYDPETDVIINPFDSRSRSWSPFNEATRPEFFTQMSEVLIPDRPNNPDQFWSQAARIVFDYTAQTLWKTGDCTNADLRKAILDIPSDQLTRLISQTPGRHFFNEEISKTAESIRANLIAELRFLEFLRDDAPPFSIREWVKNDGQGFVFLTGDAEHSAATRNIISSIFEVAANALMTCEERNDPEIWFIMDEVPTLNRMPFLSKSLAEIRQFGGAFVVGYQVFSQLEEIYGDKAAKTISGNLNNRLVFNTPDADTAEIFSKALGSEDIEEQRESITVGAHETRDGVGFMTQRIERRIVTASQIQSLPQFQGYLRFAYDAPTAFIEFKAFKTTPRAPKFIEYHGRGFAEGAMNGDARIPDLDAEPRNDASDTVDQRDLFQRYKQRLIDSGLEIFADEENPYDTQLWNHFWQERSRGKAVSEIGPPSLSHPMLGSTPLPHAPATLHKATQTTETAVETGATRGPNKADQLVREADQGAPATKAPECAPIPVQGVLPLEWDTLASHTQEPKAASSANALSSDTMGFDALETLFEDLPDHFDHGQRP